MGLIVGYGGLRSRSTLLKIIERFPLNTFNMLEDGLIVEIKEEELKKKRQEEISKDFESQGGFLEDSGVPNMDITTSVR